MNGSTNIQTAVRIRPYIAWEKNANIKPLWQVKENSIVQILDETFFGESYTFDHIFEENKTNQDVYSDVVKPLVISCLQGINSTIFAYGQTSSGKTHTMLGDKDTPGIIGLAVDDVFKYMEEKSTNNFLLRCSYLEIYNEKINDLLHSNVTDLKIREDINQGVHVIVKEEIIRTPEELFTLMKKGMKSRKVGSTDMNERSSRSHSIFKLVSKNNIISPSIVQYSPPEIVVRFETVSRVLLLEIKPTVSQHSRFLPTCHFENEWARIISIYKISSMFSHSPDNELINIRQSHFDSEFLLGS